jgi:hypothetical protein
VSRNKPTFSAIAALAQRDLPPGLNRKVGVEVSEAFAHQGFADHPLYVEVTAERPTLNTVSSAAWCPVGEWRVKAAEMLQYVLTELEAAITELQGHRDRVAQALATVQAEAAQPAEVSHDA